METNPTYSGEDQDPVIEGGVKHKDAIGSLIAISMSLLLILASSLTVIYFWKGEDNFIIIGPSSALSSWEWEYREIVGANNKTLTNI